jgi:hypothetical protein
VGVVLDRITPDFQNFWPSGQNDVTQLFQSGFNKWFRRRACPLNGGGQTFRKPMKNLIKKSEIGPITGTAPNNGWNIIKRYESRTGEVLQKYLVNEPQDGAGRKSSVAHKISDISKVIGVKQKDIKASLEALRFNRGEPLELTIYKPKK